jgi:hypothetical protein
MDQTGTRQRPATVFHQAEKEKGRERVEQEAHEFCGHL